MWYYSGCICLFHVKASYVSFCCPVFVWKKDSLFMCFSLVRKLFCAQFITDKSWISFPFDCNINFSTYEDDDDGFEPPQISANASWPVVFYFLGSGRGAFFSSCLFVVMGVVVSPHSSVELQIQRRPGHGRLPGQRPERQRLQPVGWRRRDERGGQCHLPGASIVSIQC